MQKGQIVRVINAEILPGNKIGPNINVNAEYKLQSDAFTCKCGEVHFDIGLPSEYNYITCYKCREELPLGDRTHWCHSSRFESINS